MTDDIGVFIGDDILGATDEEDSGTTSGVGIVEDSAISSECESSVLFDMGADRFTAASK